MRGGWLLLVITTSCAGQCPSTERARGTADDPGPAVPPADDGRGGTEEAGVDGAVPATASEAGSTAEAAGTPDVPAGVVLAEWEWLEAAEPGRAACSRNTECSIAGDCCTCEALGPGETLRGCGPLDEQTGLGVNTPPERRDHCYQQANACLELGLSTNGTGWCVAGECRIQPGSDILVRVRQTGGPGRLDVDGLRGVFERKRELLRRCVADWFRSGENGDVRMTVPFTVPVDGTAVRGEPATTAAGADARRLDLCLESALSLNLVSMPPAGGAAELEVDLTFRRNPPPGS